MAKSRNKAVYFVACMAAAVAILIGTGLYLRFALAITRQTQLTRTYANVDEARRAIAADKNDAMAHRTVALYDERHHDMIGAVREWQEAVRIEPGNRASRQWLATALIASGRKEEALPILRELASVDDAYGRVAKESLVKLQAEHVR